MENKTYLVELTPLGNYFFGSENTFSTTDKAGNNGSITNYLVRSRQYPQQTALLGLLRYVVLLKNEALNELPDAKGKLVGFKSFQGLEQDAPESWGNITSITPLFLKRKNENYITAGQDVQYYVNENHEESLTELGVDHKAGASASYTDKGLSFFPNYNPKQHHESLWKNVNNETSYLKPGQVFKESFQVGISKSFNGNSDNDAFYKQFFYKLEKDFSFAFYCTTKEPLKDADKPVIAPFGADQSLFQIKFTEKEDIVFSKPQVANGLSKITLLSDAYCSSEILTNCMAAITNSVDFRYIKTNVSTKRYYNVSKKADDMQKSAKLNLLERGSVLYTDNPSVITGELDKQTAYRNAGFNYYSIQPITLK